MSARQLVRPKWLRDLERLLGVRRQFVFEGNIRDEVALAGKDRVERLPFSAALCDSLLRCGYRVVIFWDLVSGITVRPMDKQSVAIARGIEGLEKISDTGTLALKSPLELSRVVARLGDSETAAGCAMVVDYASRIAKNAASLDGDERTFFLACEKAANDAQPKYREGWKTPRFNPVIWLCNRAQDLPSWFLVDNPGIHTITVALPDSDTRFAVAMEEMKEIDGTGDDTARSAAAAVMAGRTDGMQLVALREIGELARNNLFGLSDIDLAVKSHQVGDLLTEDRWRGEALKDKIRKADQESILSERVKGQQRAVTKVLDMLKRTALGLTGAHSRSSPARPKGIMFFAGPTGVGKTEMAKAIAHVVFDDEEAMLRFDMSEFSAEHSDARLIGAPPGYVGYEAGGQLTDALREKPFRVILFDEIEKAHPRILDKFLQILEDGRLTDGRGETVYFSESVIIFTSNLGVNVDTVVELPGGRPIIERKKNVQWGKQTYDELEQKIKDAIVAKFRLELNRPEILNRIGEDNIVVFDYISEQAGREIFAGNLEQLLKTLTKESDISVNVGAVRDALEAHCLGDLENGGRGIGARLEAAFTNSLTRALFDCQAKAGSSWRVMGFGKDKSGVFSVRLTPQN